MLSGTITLVSALCFSPSEALATTGGVTACDTSDAQLLFLQEQICASIGGCPAGNVTAHGDWPNQVVYMHDMMAALVDPKTCLNTSQARETVEWLNIVDAVPSKSPFWWTWVVFQVQYYDMPRKAGDRIESPATLGRKCWAFAYLRQIWPSLRPSLRRAAATAGLGLDDFVAAYDAAIPLTVGLCEQVMANCFVNVSYDPVTRNGTCPQQIDEFFVGYQWENGGGNSGRQPNFTIDYPFPQYTESAEFRAHATAAVSTALNYIV